LVSNFYSFYFKSHEAQVTSYTPFPPSFPSYLIQPSDFQSPKIIASYPLLLASNSLLFFLIHSYSHFLCPFVALNRPYFLLFALSEPFFMPFMRLFVAIFSVKSVQSVVNNRKNLRNQRFKLCKTNPILMK